jgi:DNA-binding CsgD family transcriptional regulator
VSPREDETPDWSWTDDADMPSDDEIDTRRVRGARPEPLPLSEQQLTVLNMLANGLRYADIAEQTGLHVTSVKDSARLARQKLAAKTIEHAVAIAIRNGLIR